MKELSITLKTLITDLIINDVVNAEWCYDDCETVEWYKAWQFKEKLKDEWMNALTTDEYAEIYKRLKRDSND